MIENKRTRVNKALKIMREFKTKPRFKDKYGNNVKQHFGIYKYFINTTNQEKEKFYISQECRKVSMKDSVNVLKQEEEQMTRFGKSCYFDSIKRPKSS